MISVFSLGYLSRGSKELPPVYSSVGIPGNLQRLTCDWDCLNLEEPGKVTQPNQDLFGPESVDL
jgi:hypothetical protein